MDRDLGTLGPRPPLAADLERAREAAMWKARAEKLEAFADWLIRMDNPNDMEAKVERQKVTLTEIIRRAQEARS